MRSRDLTVRAERALLVLVLVLRVEAFAEASRVLAG